MNHIFKLYLRNFVLVFFDDILVFSMDFSCHLCHLRVVLTVLLDNKLYAKRSKCVFGCVEMEYLGHLISGHGVRTDPRKTKAMLQWPIPTSVKALRGFLGLTSYYRKFVKDYGLIAAPLTALLKKDSFHWSTQVDLAFNTLKQAMSQPPVLALPNFTKPFVIECDALGTSLGAILMQNHMPLAFHSQALKGRSLLLSTYEKELLALVTAMKKWRTYLVGRPFVIKTDQQSLKFLLEQRIGTPAQQKWFTKLLGYSFIVEYKKGKENKAANALSRKGEGSYMQAGAALVQSSRDVLAQDGSLFNISFPCPAWLTILKDSYEEGDEYKQLISSLSGSPSSPTNFSLQNGLILYRDKLFLSSSSPLKSLVLQHVHDSPVGGYSGYLKTLYKVKQDFFWKGMKSDVKRHVKHYEVCQRIKVETTRPRGLLQPLPIPSKPWTDISLDFINSLPKSHGFEVIMVVVDRLTKYVHFMPLSHPYTAAKVAAMFMKDIFRLHGMPQSIVSDKDVVFTSKFWQELFKLQGSNLAVSSVYHPQKNGQTEMVNRSLE